MYLPLLKVECISLLVTDSWAPLHYSLELVFFLLTLGLPLQRRTKGSRKRQRGKVTVKWETITTNIHFNVSVARDCRTGTARLIHLQTLRNENLQRHDQVYYSRMSFAEQPKTRPLNERKAASNFSDSRSSPPQGYGSHPRVKAVN